jgi:hypothetical protein
MFSQSFFVPLPTLSRFTLYAVDSRGGHSEYSYVSVRTSCPMVDDSRAEGTVLTHYLSDPQIVLRLSVKNSQSVFKLF